MEETPQVPIQVSREHRWRKAGIATLCLVVVLLAAGGYIYHRSHINPVPASVRKSVSFTIYYPGQKKLPTGYQLDNSSFRLAESGAILFSVSYGSNRSLVFSEAAKPAGDVIDKFNASAIPVHTQVNTTIGKALVGAYGSGKDLRTIISLPITGGPWLIITAPSDINQADLQKVLQAISR